MKMPPVACPVPVPKPALMAGLAMTLALPLALAPAQAAPCVAERTGIPRTQATAAAPLPLAQVRDGRLLTTSGAELVVKGLVIPTQASGIQALADAAQSATAATIANRRLYLEGAPDLDRYGASRVQGRLDAPDGPDLAEALLRNGAGYADPTTLPDCQRRLLDAETAARKAGRGIWAVPGAVVPAGALPTLRARTGTFTVVEGRISGQRSFRGTSTLYFAPPGQTALIVTLPSEPDATFLRYGPAPAMLRGTLIRVRGVVREDRGPVIAVHSAGQMVALEERAR